MDKTIFEQMGGTYHQEGDYFLPDLPPLKAFLLGYGDTTETISEKPTQSHLYWPATKRQVDGHLAEIDAQAEAMLFQLVNQLAEQEGITEHSKLKIRWNGFSA